MSEASDQEIREKAYFIWVHDGCLDGEEIIDSYLGRMKRRDYHWQLARVIVNGRHQEWKDGFVLPDPPEVKRVVIMGHDLVDNGNRRK